MCVPSVDAHHANKTKQNGFPNFYFPNDHAIAVIISIAFCPLPTFDVGSYHRHYLLSEQITIGSIDRRRFVLLSVNDSIEAIDLDLLEFFSLSLV